jgi:hypothetical protein
VPPELQQVRTLIAQGKLLAAIDQLWISARLGSGTAAAILGYVCLRDPALTMVDRQEVARLCRESANRSNAYAQYVVACSEYEQGNYKAYARWLIRSARTGFVPAVSDYGRDMLIATRGTRWKQLYARRQLRRAVFRGHWPGAFTLIRTLAAGKFGWGLAILGFIALPIAVLIGPAFIYFQPFSLGVFMHPLGARQPIFDLSEAFSSSPDAE